LLAVIKLASVVKAVTEIRFKGGMAIDSVGPVEGPHKRALRHRTVRAAVELLLM
jgi:hypothetical protein